MDPTLPEDEWNSANTAKQQFPPLPTEGTAEDFCKTYHNVDRVIAAQGHEDSMEHFMSMCCNNSIHIVIGLAKVLGCTLSWQ